MILLSKRNESGGIILNVTRGLTINAVIWHLPFSLMLASENLIQMFSFEHFKLPL